MARAPKDHKTNALRELDAAGIPHEELFFDAEPTMTGEEIARSQGEDPDAVFKTLCHPGQTRRRRRVPRARGRRGST